MKLSEKTRKIWVEISRIIVGATFIFSGFVKAVDPFGFAYKIQDYLISFNLTELFPLALPAAVLLIVLEFAVGIFVFLGIYKKWASVLALVFMLFFTPLTLWIALNNPVKDCGCFGDALVISNWQTFYKNIVLLVAAAALFFYSRFLSPFFSKKTAWLAGIFSVLFALLFALHNVYNLPVFDFRPYKIGANIPENMRIDPANADVYENIFIYSKNGKKQEFSEENYPWNDSTWTFVEMKSKQIKKGTVPKIEDFSIRKIDTDSANIWHETGEITNEILSDSSYVFLMVSPLFKNMKTSNMDAFEAINTFARERNYRFYILTSWTFEQIATWDEAHKTSGFLFCHGDERILKTMIRSNPGLMLLKNGTIVGKWSSRHAPSVSELKKITYNIDSKGIRSTKRNNVLTLSVIVLIFMVPLLAIKWLDTKQKKK